MNFFKGKVPESQIDLTLAPIWSMIPQVKRKIRSELEDYNNEIIDAIEFASSELLENAIKYCDMDILDNEIEYHCQPTFSSIKILVKNKIPRDGHNVKKLYNIVNSLKIDYEDKKRLYAQRAQQILENGLINGSCLGLYRISLEGFDLKVEINQNVVNVTAQKIISEQRKTTQKIASFKDQNLEIHVERSGDDLIVYWRGKSENREPNEVLEPFLREIIRHANGLRVISDFRQLEFMNSATVTSIIYFMKLLNENLIPANFYYNGSFHWQKQSFVVMDSISRALFRIRVIEK